MCSTRPFLLGTANLGMAYGATNSEQYSRKLSQDVIELAIDRGITSFDTSPVYGVAEELLGKLIKKNPKAQVITKIPTLQSYTFEEISEHIDSSLERMNLEKIHGVLFHDPEIMNKHLDKSITEQILETNKVEKVGFSAYSEADLMRSKELFPKWTVFQIPENILNRNSFESRNLQSLCDSGDDIYVRSVFMQGLLISNTQKIDKKYSALFPILDSVSQISKSLGIGKIDLCLNYANAIPWSRGTIVAAANTHQLQEILEFKQTFIDFSLFPQMSTSISDPRNWSKL